MDCLFFLLYLQIFKCCNFLSDSFLGCCYICWCKSCYFFMFSNCPLTLSSWTYIILTVKNLVVCNTFLLFIKSQTFIGLFVFCEYVCLESLFSYQLFACVSKSSYLGEYFQLIKGHIMLSSSLDVFIW